MTLTDEYTYFIDRALGKSVGQALQQLGVNVEFHQGHFEPDAPDTEWLPFVSQKGWIVLTKDQRIGNNILELKAIAISNARVFILTSGKLFSKNMQDIFVNTINKIAKMTQGNQAPFIAKVYRDGRVIVAY